MARIEVRFLIDANGILNVTARDAHTGKEQSFDVTPSYGLTNDQVEAMILESFTKAEDDFKQRQLREAQVEADAVMAAVEKARKDKAFLELTADEQEAVDRSISELQVVYYGDDHNLIRAKIDQVDAATQKLAETIMNNALGEALQGGADA